MRARGDCDDGSSDSIESMRFCFAKCFVVIFRACNSILWLQIPENHQSDSSSYSGGRREGSIEELNEILAEEKCAAYVYFFIYLKTKVSILSCAILSTVSCYDCEMFIFQI